MESGMADRGCGEARAEAPDRAAQERPRVGFDYLRNSVPEEEQPRIPAWDEETWRRLEEQLDAQSPIPAVRAEIEYQVSMYLVEAIPRAAGAPQYVRTSEMAKRLCAIAVAAERLRTLLMFDGDDIRERHEGTYIRGRLAERAPLVRIDALPHLIDSLTQGARAAIGDLPENRTGRGRHRDEAFDYLVCRLADLFEEQTGRRATAWRDGVNDTYGGAFFEFMCLVVEYLPGIEMKEGALGEAVQRSLAERRSRQNSQARGEF
jgi:hypothetical protein